MHFRISYTLNAKDIFRSSIGCEIMLMIKARIRLIFSRYTLFRQIIIKGNILNPSKLVRVQRSGMDLILISGLFADKIILIKQY